MISDLVSELEVATISHEHNFIDLYFDGNSEGCFPDIPIQFKDLIQAVAMGLMRESRIFWWPILPRILPGTDLLKLPKIKEIASKQFRAAKDRMLMQEIPETGSMGDFQKARVFELMLLICNVYDISEPALLRQFVKIIVLTIPSSDICFQLCCDVLARGPSFLSRNCVEHRLKLCVFRELVMRYFSTEDWERLQQIHALENCYLNLLFVNLFSTLLPPDMVLRILDMFLLEGVIVLHRLGLGLLAMHTPLLETASSASDFWEGIAQASRYFPYMDLYESARGVGKLRIFFMFSDDFEVQTTLLEETEQAVRAQLSETGELRSLRSHRRASTLDSAWQDPFSVAMLSHSRLLDMPAVQALRMYLGVYSADDFGLCFSTYRDGWSLDTLYALTALRAPCIILVRSLETQALVGAFLPVPLSPPSLKVRGDGRTFIFRLDGAHPKCFSWRHKAHGRDGVNEAVSSAALAHQQFAVCSSSNLIIGGSAKHGTNALRLDSDLKTCFCGPSDTFDNDPLVPEEFVQPFVIDDMEVFCGL